MKLENITQFCINYRMAIAPFFFLTLITCKAPSKVIEAEAPLNVLLIAVDDLRPELGCYGKEYIHSPNIDQLASQGLVFDRAFCQQALCSPSRTSLLTGLRPDATHIYDLVTHFRQTVPNVTTLPQYFKQNGYHTEWWGKIFHAALLDSISWTQQGNRFEPEDNWRAYQLEESKRLAAQKNGHGPPYEMADVADNAYPDGKIAESAVEALGRLKGKPFFLALGFYKPHLPFNAPKKYWDMYDSSAIPLPLMQNPPKDAPDLALSYWGELRSYSLMPRKGNLDEQMTKKLIHGYRACVSYTDAQIGKVLKELDRLGLRKNTIVILWGDHGWKLGDYGEWSKQTNFEIDTRAPLIISTPRMLATGKHTQALTEFVDVYPTLCELSGLPVPDHLQGKSFSRLLNKPELKHKKVALSQYTRQNGKVMGYSMRTERYRFTKWQNVESKEVVAMELYDHKDNNPTAQANLASLPQYADTVAILNNLLDKEWETSLNDKKKY